MISKFIFTVDNASTLISLLHTKFTFVENTWKPKINTLKMFMFGLMKPDLG